MTTQITANNIAAHTITVTQLVPGVLSPKIQTVSICDSSYNVLDDTAANTDGGYIQITGSTFGANSQVIIGTNNATSVTVVNTSTIRAQVPAASATSYPVYVIDGDTGATAIKINGLTHSSFPAWSTESSLSNQASNTSFGVNLSVSSDSNITYTNTSALPDGTSLAANGYFSGTVSIGEQTTYSFDVKATDVENQDNTRTFSLTVTVISRLYNMFVSGDNTFGQLGQNDLVKRSSPTQVGSSTGWNILGATANNPLVIKTNLTLWSWGMNYSGGGGLNRTASVNSPTQVGTSTDWSITSKCGSISAGAIKTDGTLWTWGNNGAGYLGLNDRVNRSSPVQVGSGTTWLNVAVGYNSIAVKTDGTLWTWGDLSYGASGLNDTVIRRSSPTQVGAGTTWTSLISTGTDAHYAIKTDGTLWSWGRNDFGQLGKNDVVHRSSPVQVGTDTNWNYVFSQGSTTVIAAKTNGTMWTWGNNTNGVLGLNDTTHRSSPTQVGTDTNWLKSSISGEIGLAVKSDKTLWSWGTNSSGGLGKNDVVLRSSPVQIGALTNWSGDILAIGLSIFITN